MPLRYSCFISYCHGEGELMRRFIEDLTGALKTYLDPYFDQEEQIYLDKERLQPGYLYNEALATALCQSACMVVVYVPKYERHAYCRREFEAMERIEARRRQVAKVSRERGMIIPVILRGSPVPEKLKGRRQMLDFSKYTTVTTKITRNRKYVEEIDRVAQAINAVYEELKKAEPEICSSCDEFALPTEQEAQPWTAVLAEPVYPR